MEKPARWPRGRPSRVRPHASGSLLRGAPGPSGAHLQRFLTGGVWRGSRGLRVHIHVLSAGQWWRLLCSPMSPPSRVSLDLGGDGHWREEEMGVGERAGVRPHPLPCSLHQCCSGLMFSGFRRAVASWLESPSKKVWSGWAQVSLSPEVSVVSAPTPLHPTVSHSCPSVVPLGSCLSSDGSQVSASVTSEGQRRGSHERPEVDQHPVGVKGTSS